LAEELRQIETEAEFSVVDVRKDEDLERVTSLAATKFGGLDIAVNNVGTDGTLAPSSSRRKRLTLPFSTPMFLAHCLA
jgi:NAD(P)-dependent dehydrogenase (short-subunit alcohol dehydrogenase family)